jgi:hypothetical protein
MSATGVLVDTNSPGTIEDIEWRTPESEHTGNIRRLGALNVPTELRWTTTAARPPRHWHSSSGGARTQQAEASQCEVQRTQGEGQEWFYLLSYLNARIVDSTVFPVYPELPHVITVQLSGRTQERFGLLAAARHWHAVRDALFTNVSPSAPVALPALIPLREAVSLPPAALPMPQGHSVPDIKPVTSQGIQIVEAKTALTSGVAQATVAEVVRGLRNMIDLPVQDLARMCGVSRRQFYNLMNGGSQPAATQERRLRDLHAKAGNLYVLLDEEATSVRAAVLTPLATGVGSFYDAAVSGNPPEIDAAFEQLLGTVRRGATRAVALAPSGLLRPDHPAWDQASELLGMRGSESISHDGSDER